MAGEGAGAARSPKPDVIDPGKWERDAITGIRHAVVSEMSRVSRYATPWTDQEMAVLRRLAQTYDLLREDPRGR